MATTTKSQDLACNMNELLSRETEAQISNSSGRKGGWITFPFIIGNWIGMALSSGGVFANLIVYLIREFNVKSIDAAQISNVVSGCIGFFPIIGAIIADSFLGCFSVVLISSCFSLVGSVLFALTATLDSLRPPPCEDGGSSLCKSPSKLQLAVLYTGIAVASIGIGGSRSTIATMGANQFDKYKDQETFFNWYFFTMYTSAVTSATVIVYVEDNVSWRLGFGLCTALSLIGVLIFVSGKRFYRQGKPQGSPFMGLAGVAVACIKKRKLSSSSRTEDYYHGHDDHDSATRVDTQPTKTFRFLNRAAMKVEGDLTQNGSIAKPWRLSTVQQVEDFKTLLRLSPLWLSSILLSTPIAIQGSLTILQTLTMDRHLFGSHFKIPAGSFSVLVFISTSIFLTLLDRLIYPTWQNLTRRSPPTPLLRIGIGHVVNILGMAVSAIVESKRLKMVHSYNQQRPMLALWLFPQLILVGIGEAFHFPGQVSLYYQEFPASLRNTATAMVILVTGIAFYLSTAFIDVVRRVTGWLPDNINDGRLDKVYWTVVVLGVLNFGYYLICAKLYKYQNVNGKSAKVVVVVVDANS
ncbi:Proton-dependent oligopeptide transporter [Trema orientale]|uniref:Proton-dependent oligopeptide transporter n=1 Tax=Trema orientale TaxID=63057 RepID=A0A2P5FUU2_TREOI|nr:Proton-dependent oligopeptide transporter [Trema orientale]